ncbi:hypothetical protein DFH07DRAFT_1037309 [Mycena maculata]|uniref:Uncharacterized protein n=1 Tax=Mycena maculata TaxID=230809 RepID=A0AAD7ING9_9AGAR|nr:hypothetical protein DFH07DRAFT_1037309 [Mycena maculata]
MYSAGWLLSVELPSACSSPTAQTTPTRPPLLFCTSLPLLPSRLHSHGLKPSCPYSDAPFLPPNPISVGAGPSPPSAAASSLHPPACKQPRTSSWRLSTPRNAPFAQAPRPTPKSLPASSASPPSGASPSPLWASTANPRTRSRSSGASSLPPPRNTRSQRGW